MSRLEDHLEALREARTKQHRLNLDIKGDVAAARTAQATWAQIAEALGTSKQAAWERFSTYN